MHLHSSWTRFTLSHVTQALVKLSVVIDSSNYYMFLKITQDTRFPIGNNSYKLMNYHPVYILILELERIVKMISQAFRIISQVQH